MDTVANRTVLANLIPPPARLNDSGCYAGFEAKILSTKVRRMSPDNGGGGHHLHVSLDESN